MPFFAAIKNLAAKPELFLRNDWIVELFMNQSPSSQRIKSLSHCVRCTDRLFKSTQDIQQKNSKSFENCQKQININLKLKFGVTSRHIPGPPLDLKLLFYQMYCISSLKKRGDTTRKQHHNFLEKILAQLPVNDPCNNSLFYCMRF